MTPFSQLLRRKPWCHPYSHDQHFSGAWWATVTQPLASPLRPVPPQSVLNTEARPIFLKHVYIQNIPLLKTTNTPQRTLDLTMPWCSTWAVCSYRSGSSPAPLALTAPPASRKGIFIPQTGREPSHLRSFAFDILTGMPAPALAISFPHFFRTLTLATATKMSLPHLLLLIAI